MSRRPSGRAASSARSRRGVARAAGGLPAPRRGRVPEQRLDRPDASAGAGGGRRVRARHLDARHDRLRRGRRDGLPRGRAGGRGAAAQGPQIDDVAIVKSATEAFAMLAWWVRPAAGANVVTIDIEHPSTAYPWLRVARETGAEARLVSVWDDPASLSVERVAAEVDSDTAVIVVSYVQYSTGYRFVLRELADLAPRHGALLAVDATQALGMAPIDVGADDVDIVVAGGYKWLCGPFGAAVCCCAPSSAPTSTRRSSAGGAPSTRTPSTCARCRSRRRPAASSTRRWATAPRSRSAVRSSTPTSSGSIGCWPTTTLSPSALLARRTRRHGVDPSGRRASRWDRDRPLPGSRR